jgi:hypothetical protein
MCPQPTNKPSHGLVFVAMVLIVVGVGLAPLAFAGIALNTIDPGALVTDDSRHLIVTGPIACTAGEGASLRVTVTQRATGAVAGGRTRITCTGDLQPWEVQLLIQAQATFQAGPATAVAVARTTAAGAPTDAHQWLVEITLVGE